MADAYPITGMGAALAEGINAFLERRGQLEKSAAEQEKTQQEFMMKLLLSKQDQDFQREITDLKERKEDARAGERRKFDLQIKNIDNRRELIKALLDASEKGKKAKSPEQMRFELAKDLFGKQILAGGGAGSLEVTKDPKTGKTIIPRSLTGLMQGIKQAEKYLPSAEEEQQNDIVQQLINAGAFSDLGINPTPQPAQVPRLQQAPNIPAPQLPPALLNQPELFMTPINPSQQYFPSLEQGGLDLSQVQPVAPSLQRFLSGRYLG